MGKVKIGDRVGAILSANEKVVNLFGYGVYDGEHIPIFDPLGVTIEEFRDAVGDDKADFPTNPRITLDSGDIVWGYECWWGPEEEVKKMIGDREVVMVDVNNK